jgi:D-arabinose 1-dehydrogenase-like Zn-dependent alcohol dehydrogenase
MLPLLPYKLLLTRGQGGCLVFVGAYDDSAVLFLTPRSLSRELILTGSRYCTRQQLAEAVELVAQGRVRSVVTRICQLEEANEVLNSIERTELAGCACAVLP